MVAYGLSPNDAFMHPTEQLLEYPATLQLDTNPRQKPS
jgi:hypothetical protein